VVAPAQSFCDNASQSVRNGAGSMIEQWNVDDDCITEHDRRHALMTEYLLNGAPNSREVAGAIRPVLEGFLRAAYPEQFPPGTLLGPFRNMCEQRMGGPIEILTFTQIQELRELTEYANRFHHDNPAWEIEAINDGELEGFVERALSFARK
jgi:hypothetical protein